MNVHANAALSLKGRRELCRRVVERGWTVTQAAEAACVSVRCARKWVGRYRLEGELGLLDRSSAPRSIPHRTSKQRVEAIAALRRLRFTGPEIAEILDMALSTVSGVLTRIGMGRLGRLGLESAVRYERERPGELIHIDVKKLGRIIKPGHRVTGIRRQSQTTYTPDGRRTGDAGWEYVHIAIATARAWPTPKSSPTRGHHGHRLPAPRRLLLHPPRHHRRSAAHRQRLWLPLRPARDRVSHARHPPPAHPTPPPTDQRQSRTLHPHHARRLGLRRHLPQQRRTHPRPRRLDLVVQPPTTTHSPRPPTPDRPPQRANQPTRYLQLAVKDRGLRIPDPGAGVAQL